MITCQLNEIDTGLTPKEELHFEKNDPCLSVSYTQALAWIEETFENRSWHTFKHLQHYSC